MLGCKLVKICCRWADVPGPESTILVVFLAPEQSWLEFGVGVGVGVALLGVPPAVGVVVLPVALHWNDVFCALSGASEKLSGVWSGSR